jgi:hypothetical protein
MSRISAQLQSRKALLSTNRHKKIQRLIQNRKLQGNMSYQEEKQEKLIHKPEKVVSKSGFLMDVVHERGSESSFEDEEDKEYGVPFSLTNMDKSDSEGHEQKSELPESIFSSRLPKRMPKHIEQ